MRQPRTLSGRPGADFGRYAWMSMKPAGVAIWVMGGEDPRFWPFLAGRPERAQR